MAEEIRAGYYKDSNGQWQPDRRKSTDRRIGKTFSMDHERRCLFRRKADRELYERDHRAMIDDALQDFADEHHGKI